MDIGILGLGVMGRSLALNFERNGYSAAGFDLNLKFDKSLFKNKNITIFDSLEELVQALDKPRCILLMIPAGKPIDKAILSIKPYLEKDDIIIDGGNSFFRDTERRIKYLSEEGINFVGMGVSGGESGALHRPSLMWVHIVLAAGMEIRKFYQLQDEGDALSLSKCQSLMRASLSQLQLSARAHHRTRSVKPTLMIGDLAGALQYRPKSML